MNCLGKLMMNEERIKETAVVKVQKVYLDILRIKLIFLPYERKRYDIECL